MKSIDINVAIRALVSCGWILCAVPAMAGIVYSDNTIIIGNACIGDDCRSGHSFDDDILVLHENNTRISFGGISDVNGVLGNVSKFRLSANETANGGANQFSIDAKSAYSIDYLGVINIFPRTYYEAIAQADGTLIVSVEEIVSQRAYTLSDTFSGGVISFIPGQSAIVPAGSWAASGIAGRYTVSGVTALTSTAQSGDFEAQITGSMQSAVVFDEVGNMVTLGINSEDVANAVSVGSPTTLRQVQVVADAVEVTDVITLGQLTSTLSIPSSLSDRIQSQTSRLEGVSAMTAAMSALQPNPRAQAPLSISLGLGAYEGKTAAAVGLLFRVSDASHYQVSLAGSEDTSLQTSLSFKIVW